MYISIYIEIHAKEALPSSLLACHQQPTTTAACCSTTTLYHFNCTASSPHGLTPHGLALHTALRCIRPCAACQGLLPKQCRGLLFHPGSTGRSGASLSLALCIGRPLWRSWSGCPGSRSPPPASAILHHLFVNPCHVCICMYVYDVCVYVCMYVCMYA